MGGVAGGRRAEGGGQRADDGTCCASVGLPTRYPLLGPHSSFKRPIIRGQASAQCILSQPREVTALVATGALDLGPVRIFGASVGEAVFPRGPGSFRSGWGQVGPPEAGPSHQGSVRSCRERSTLPADPTRLDPAPLVLVEPRPQDRGGRGIRFAWPMTNALSAFSTACWRWKAA